MQRQQYEMKTIILPVAPLSRKILLTQYGQEPLHLGYRSLLYKQMCYNIPVTPWLERHQQVLTTTITISIHRHLWERVRQEPHQVGYHLYELHKEFMFTWVEGKVDADHPQLYAIRDFLHYHHIEEDDFSEETAYRLWKRFKESRGTNTPSTVPYLSPCLLVRLSTDQALKVAEKVEMITPVYCRRFHQNSICTLKSYILHKYTDLTVRGTALELNRDFRRVHRSIRRAESALKNYPELKEVIEYCISSVYQRQVAV
jgi:hypothetical protein